MTHASIHPSCLARGRARELRRCPSAALLVDTPELSWAATHVSGQRMERAGCLAAIESDQPITDRVGVPSVHRERAHVTSAV